MASARVVRFGAFRFDPALPELRKGRTKLKVPDQSLAILDMLLERPGEVVSREAIQARLWPHGTVVQFENNVNSAVKRLREALIDTAATPRYIETLPRKGYRFVGTLAPADDRPSELTPGTLISHYRILAEAGRGAMGVVYKAEDVTLGRMVALKFLPEALARHAPALERLRREARMIGALNHPGICTVYELAEVSGRVFLVMEFLEGESLRERMARGPVSRAEFFDISVQVAGALEAAHGRSPAHVQGMIHRDIKPDNLFLTVQGVVKLMDFGLAKLVEEASGAAEQSSVTGTSGYMSPEQARGAPLDARSDIYSLGRVLKELAGEPPPARLAPILMKALAADPAERWQSAAELQTALGRIRQQPGEKIARQSSRRRRLCLMLMLLLAAVLVAGGLYYRPHQTRLLTDKETIVLSDFDNKTGDSVFDDTLKTGLSVQLEQSPFLALVSDRRANETLKLMGRSVVDRLTPEVTREVCERTGSKAMVTGSIAGLGSQYVIGLKAVNCNTGDVLAEAQEQVAGKEAVLKGLDAAAISLRSKLGESLSSVQKYAMPLEQATTPSLEALKVYSLGLKTWNAKGDTAALPFFKRAVDLDPSFAMAYAWMSALYHDLNQIGEGVENGRKAYDLREKVSERERLFIESTYYDMSTGELEKGAQSDELWQQTYPRDDMPYIRLGFVSATLGNWEKALEEWRVAMRLDPNNGLLYNLLSLAYMSLNRLDEAEAVVKQAEERKLAHELLLQSRYWLAFLRGDTAQRAQLAAAAMGKPGSEDLLLAAQADTEGWYGNLKNAHELTGRAMDSAQHNDAKETAAGYQAEAALREVESGYRQHARAEANAAVKLLPNRDVRAIAALALARAGDTAGAEKLAAELDKTFPLDTLVQRYWLPTIRAGVALERHDPNRAIELLKVAGTIELSSATPDLTIFLCPVYLRAEAYLMLHDGNRAAAEFQKFIDHRGVVMNFPWGALARLGLARAYALQGDTAKARTAYRDFLTLWKDADPDIPLLKQAKAEFAKLK